MRSNAVRRQSRERGINLPARALCQPGARVPKSPFARHHGGPGTLTLLGKQIAFPSQRDLGVNGVAVCRIGGGTSTTHHTHRPVAFSLIVHDMVNADVSHVLATVMCSDFGENESLKFSHGHERFCHAYFPFALALAVTRLDDILDRSRIAQRFPCRESVSPEAVSLDGPPTHRWPHAVRALSAPPDRLFVEIVSHFRFVFSHKDQAEAKL